ncbi:MAG: PilT/PilU family type 4a pilus ATPase [Pirellulaceae bacterium]
MNSQLNADCPDKVRDWLTRAVDRDASDLHLITGYAPALRIHGTIQELDEPLLEANALREILLALCPKIVAERFMAEKNADFGLELEIHDKPTRFRANYFLNGGQMGACFRLIPTEIPDFEWAGFPRQIAEQLAAFRNGLVLLTGVTGAGKTTTLAMLINLINQQGGRRIITVEEPIEYLYPKVAGSVITQRELGQDVLTFADGLKYGLRQDPDVILVGEIRDRETAQMALSAAETGHLVFSTLHTRDVKGAISRYTDLFPQSVQGEIRSQLSVSLRSIISQHLLPSIDEGAKRRLALEIMFNTDPIAVGIRQNKLLSIERYILSGREDGMISLDESIKRLMDAGEISQQTAQRFVSDSSYLSS